VKTPVFGQGMGPGRHLGPGGNRVREEKKGNQSGDAQRKQNIQSGWRSGKGKKVILTGRKKRGKSEQVKQKNVDVRRVI